jgi:lipopolysaccharide export system permease protein
MMRAADGGVVQQVIIQRYLAREVLQTLLAVLVVVLLILIGRYFAVYLADAAKGEISAAIILELMVLRTLVSLPTLLPFALFIAVILAFGRLYKDSEMAAMAACGIGPDGVLGAVLRLALLCGALVAGLSLGVAPWAYEQILKVQEQAQVGTVFSSVAPGQFTLLNNKKLVFYVEELSGDRTQLRDVFVQTQTDGKLDVLSARSGYQYTDQVSGLDYLVLVDGYRYQGLPGEADFTIHEYEKIAVRLEERGVVPLQRTQAAVPSLNLLASDELRDKAELHWRLALPLATLLLPVLAVLLSKTSPRQGRFAKLFIAVFLFVIYYNSLGVGVSWLQRGSVPMAVGLWWIHALLVVLILLAAARQWGGRPWSRLLRREA